MDISTMLPHLPKSVPQSATAQELERQPRDAQAKPSVTAQGLHHAGYGTPSRGSLG